MRKGFTLLETTIVIVILVILTLASASFLVVFGRRSALNNNVEEIITVIKYAQSRTLASEDLSQYGVYFDTTTSPHEYVLFKGVDFLSRDISFDKTYELSKTVDFSNIDLDGGNEFVFERLTGMTNQPGEISLELKSDITQTETIYIDGFGGIELTVPAVPSENPVTDSRHIHLNYNTATEKIVLTFDNGTVIEEIIIADYLDGDVFSWEGEVEVGEETQVIKIHTHRLNNPDSQICIHRDRRFNNKSLVVSIDVDMSGSLADYSSDGLITNYSSIYVSEFNEQ